MIFRKILALFFFVVLAAQPVAWAVDEDPRIEPNSQAMPEGPSDSTTAVFSSTLLESRNARFDVYPFAFYSPEVDVAFGVGGLITFFTSEEMLLRPSKMGVSGWYATSSQYSIVLAPKAYFLQNRIFVSAKLFLTDKTYFTPDPEKPELDATTYGTVMEFRMPALFKLKSGWQRKVGIIVDYLNMNLKDVPDDEELSHTLGLGMTWAWDSRDNVFYPLSGNFVLTKAMFFSSDLGSDFDFNRYEVDARSFIPINSSRKQVLAAQVYFEGVSGDPPFYRIPELGGANLMRGYKKGELRDQYYLTSQVEFRTQLWRRFGGVAFVGIGALAGDPSGFRLDKAKYSYGVGLRYTFNTRDDVNIRVDLGFGDDTPSWYVSVEEAF